LDRIWRSRWFLWLSQWFIICFYLQTGLFEWLSHLLSSRCSDLLLEWLSLFQHRRCLRFRYCRSFLFNLRLRFDLCWLTNCLLQTLTCILQLLLRNLWGFLSFFWSYFLWLRFLTDLLYFFFRWLRLFLLWSILVSISLLLQRRLTILMRSLILEWYWINLVFLVVCDLGSFVEHVFIWISCYVK
jgi:hypothetical protein